ncbi:MAG: hypothetical protein AB2A00_40870 [Myxococcota bacterium]
MKWWLLVLPVFAACSPSSSSSGGDGGAGTSSSSGSSGGSSSSSGGGVTLSVGNAAYGETHVDLPNDATVQVVAGPQGGFHIWLSVRATGVPESAITSGLGVRYLLTREGSTVATGRVALSKESDGSGVVQDVGIVMFFDGAISAWDWQEETVNLSVALQQGTTDLVSSERKWEATCCDASFGGGQGNGLDGGDGVGGAPQSCTTWCDLIMDGCPGDPPRYATRQACEEDCANFPLGGLPGYGSGDTLQCRIVHASTAQEDSGACARLQSDEDAFCVDGCGYYCALMRERCPQIQFSEETCPEACAGFPSGGARGDTSGNTLHCRIHFAELAIPNPQEHCTNAGPVSAGACVD